MTTLAENIAALTEAVDGLDLDGIDIDMLRFSLDQHTDALNRFCDLLENKPAYTGPMA